MPFLTVKRRYIRTEPLHDDETGEQIGWYTKGADWYIARGEITMPESVPEPLPKSVPSWDGFIRIPGGIDCAICGKTLGSIDDPRSNPAESYAGTYTGLCYGCERSATWACYRCNDGLIYYSHPARKGVRQEDQKTRRRRQGRAEDQIAGRIRDVEIRTSCACQTPRAILGL